MKQVLTIIKPYLRWFILGGTLFFLLKTFKDNWREVAAIRIEGTGWLILGLALIVTLIAHIWSGLVWTWILRSFQQPLGGIKALIVYLKTNIAKYLPGNIWHFYGRIVAVTEVGGSLSIASLTVLLEPLLMAAAALLIALLSSSFGVINTAENLVTLSLQVASLIVVLLGVHPLIINPVIQLASKLQGKTNTVQIANYPLVPLLGELGFLGLRGTGFLLTFLALETINISQIPQLLSAFSFAWLLGLIIPGAPGGIGIFEATTIALLNPQQFPAAIILSVVAIFRVVSILAEIIAAGLAWLAEKYT